MLVAFVAVGDTAVNHSLNWSPVSCSGRTTQSTSTPAALISSSAMLTFHPLGVALKKTSGTILVLWGDDDQNEDAARRDVQGWVLACSRRATVCSHTREVQKIFTFF